MKPLLNFICVGERPTWPDVFTIRHYSSQAAQVDSTIYRRNGEPNDSLWARLNQEVDRLYRHEGREFPCVVFFDYQTTPAAAALIDDELVNFQNAIRRMAKRDCSPAVRAYAQGLCVKWILDAEATAPEERGLLQ